MVFGLASLPPPHLQRAGRPGSPPRGPRPRPGGLGRARGPDVRARLHRPAAPSRVAHAGGRDRRAGRGATPGHQLGARVARGQRAVARRRRRCRRGHDPGTRPGAGAPCAPQRCWPGCSTGSGPTSRPSGRPGPRVTGCCSIPTDGPSSTRRPTPASGGTGPTGRPGRWRCCATPCSTCSRRPTRRCTPLRAARRRRAVPRRQPLRATDRGRLRRRRRPRRPAVPVRVADRSLRQDNPLLDAAGALLDLLDGRFRASSVLGLRRALPRCASGSASTPPPSPASASGRRPPTCAGVSARPIARRFGHPVELDVHTWRAGLDQLLVGATMAAAGPRLGPGRRRSPSASVEGDDVEVPVRWPSCSTASSGAVGAAAHAGAGRSAGVRRSPRRRRAVPSLPTPTRGSGGRSSAWSRTSGRRPSVDGVPRSVEVDPARPGGAGAGPARRLGGAGPASAPGAVTVSSLTAQRGRPPPGGLPARPRRRRRRRREPRRPTTSSRPRPCVGDRDARSEQRAQLLDAVLAADERLLLFSTGHDVRTNAELPPVVALAELIDVVDATVRVPEDPSGRVPRRELLTVDHPRQAWSERAWCPASSGAPGPWTFDRGALAAAVARRSQGLPCRLPGRAPRPRRRRGEGPRPVPLDELLDGLRQPGPGCCCDADCRSASPPRTTRSTTRSRSNCGASSGGGWSTSCCRCASAPAPSTGAARRRGPPGPVGPGDTDEARWEHVERRRGAVPPLAFGDAAIDGARTLDALVAELAASWARSRAPDPVGRRGRVSAPPAAGGRRGHRARGLRRPPRHRLRLEAQAKDRLAGVGAARRADPPHPERTWRAAVIGRGRSWTEVDVVRIGLESPDAAAEVLAVARRPPPRARADAVPASPRPPGRSTRRAWARPAQRVGARFGGDGTDRWVTTGLRFASSTTCWPFRSGPTSPPRWSPRRRRAPLLGRPHLGRCRPHHRGRARRHRRPVAAEVEEVP